MATLKSESRWFCAACLGLTGLVLVFSAFDASTSPDSAALQVPLIVGAAIAFVLMGVAMAFASRLDRGDPASSNPRMTSSSTPCARLDMDQNGPDGDAHNEHGVAARS